MDKSNAIPMYFGFCSGLFPIATVELNDILFAVSLNSFGLQMGHVADFVTNSAPHFLHEFADGISTVFSRTDGTVIMNPQYLMEGEQSFGYRKLDDG